MQKELMRRHILEKSLELFTTSEPDKITMEELARYCSITKPTLYSYFRNKGDIMLALFEDIYEMLFSRIKSFQEQQSPHTDSWGCFEKLFGEITEFFLSNRQIMMTLIRETHKGGYVEDFDDHIHYWKKKREGIVELLGEIVAPLLKPELQTKFGIRIVVITVFQIISGILTDLYFLENNNINLYKEFLKELFQRGIFIEEAR